MMMKIIRYIVSIVEGRLLMGNLKAEGKDGI
jgi:hypothetical protein